MKPHRDIVVALCGMGAGIDVIGDWWERLLQAYDAAQEQAFADGGLGAVRTLTDTIGLEILTTGLRQRMAEVGLIEILTAGLRDQQVNETWLVDIIAAGLRARIGECDVLDLVTAALRQRMVEVGLGPLVYHQDADPVRRPRSVGSETLQ